MDLGRLGAIVRNSDGRKWNNGGGSRGGRGGRGVGDDGGSPQVDELPARVAVELHSGPEKMGESKSRNGIAKYL